MRIAVISDTHMSREDEVLETLWGHLHGVDLILHAGDVVTRPVVDALARIAPVEGVAGNSDPPEIARLWPKKRVLELGAHRVGLIHGSGSPHKLDIRVLQEFEWVDVLIFGHTHVPLVRQMGGLLLLNPGSATWPRAEDRRPTIAMLDLNERPVARIVPI